MVEQASDTLDRFRQDADLTRSELWLRYFELGGMSTALQLEAILYGALLASPHDYDVIAHALNERFVELGETTPSPTVKVAPVLSPKRLMTDIVLNTATPVQGGQGGQVRSHHRGRNSSGDAELINSVARGDQGARAQLYERHRSCVHQLAIRLYGRDQALRVTDEIFSALWSASEVVDITDNALCTVLLIATRDRRFAGVAR